MSMTPPTPTSEAVAVILVNWNSWVTVIECVDSLLTQSYSNFHVFVVDNDSQDGSVEKIQQWCAAPWARPEWRTPSGVGRVTASNPTAPISLRIVDRSEQALSPAAGECRLTVVRSGANLGFAGGCNVGIRAAGLEAFAFFWLLNTDTVVHTDALQALIRRARAGGERQGMVGSTLRYYDRPDVVQALGGSFMEPASLTTRHIATGSRLDDLKIDPAQVERQLFYIFGASMLVSRRFVAEIGLMQEDYFLYYEEIDWAMRGRQRFGLGYAPDSHVFHKSGASSSKVASASAFSTNLYYRNRVRFTARFFPGRLGTVRRGLAVELLYHVLHGYWTHARIVAATLWHSRTIAAQVQPFAGALSQSPTTD